MPDSFRAWVDFVCKRYALDADRGGRIYFGTEPETRIKAIRDSRTSYTNYIGDQSRITASDVVVDLGSERGLGQLL